MNMSVGWVFFYLLVFPGFLFTSVVGLLYTWIDRKVTARIQFRVGPPLLQVKIPLCLKVLHVLFSLALHL